MEYFIVNNINELLQWRIDRSGFDDAVVINNSGVQESISWGEYGEHIKQVGMGLYAQGVRAGDRVAIIATSSPEWAICDLGIMGIGAITVAIYPENTPKEISNILEESDAKICIVDHNRLLNRIIPLMQKETFSGSFVVIQQSENLPHQAITLSDLKIGGEHLISEFDQLASEVTRDQTATIVYTSGTEGNPRGVILTHQNLIANINGISRRVSIHEDDLVMIYMPLAHIFARIVSLLTLKTGMGITYAENGKRFEAGMLLLKPTILACVPRIYEKFYNRGFQIIKNHGKFLLKTLEEGISVGERIIRLKQEQKAIPLHLKSRNYFFQKAIFSPLRKELGGRVRLLFSAGAPLNSDLIRKFHIAGLSILEGYGLTETAGALTLSSPDCFLPGSVGKPLDGVTLKCSSGGEIICKGEMITSGYYNRDILNKNKVLFKDGWFHTGDLGYQDQNGNWYVTDRKKELIITSSGKKIAPGPIETLLRSGFIQQIVILGDQRPYLIALIYLNQEALIQVAEEADIPYNKIEVLLTHEKICNRVADLVQKVNETLARHETIKQFALIETPLSVENRMLTPTGKIRRQYCEAYYRELVEQLY